MELLEVFDDLGNMTGKSVARGKKEDLKEHEHFATVIIFIQNSEGNFLMQKTSHLKSGKYSSTGGHVDSGETPLMAIRREVKEEIGLNIDNEELVDLGFFIHGSPLRFVFYLKKDVKLTELQLQTSEVESVQYMTKEQIQQLKKEDKMTRSHGIAFQKVLEYIEENKN